MSLWQRYQPTKTDPWDLKRVIHLLRRVVFGGTWNEIRRDLADSPEAAVNRVLHGECRTDGVPEDFETMAGLIGTSAADSSNPDRLKAWWIYCCLFSPDPLSERLTFMWHNHFATSNLKVDSLAQMKRQNDALRANSRSKFGDLLSSMLHDPALLVWLDAPVNRKGHPNENLARESMELFTLGIGHYTETDVKHAARALTGITVRDGEYDFDARKHDDDKKTILGQTGLFGETDFAELLLKHPATADRLAWRLTREFFGEDVLDDAARSELATSLRESELDIGQAVETILHSRLFFSEANLNSRICDPLSFLLIPLRGLGLFAKPPSTLLLADWLRKMGLDLFYPPNVGGWDGSRKWLNTRTVIARTNYIAALVGGTIHRPVDPPDLASLYDRQAGNGELRSFSDFAGNLLCGGISARDLDNTLANLPELPDRSLSEHARVVLQLMSQPKAHLH